MLYSEYIEYWYSKNGAQIITLITEFFRSNSFLPESIKWQLSRDRIDEAKLNVRKVAEMNGKKFNDQELYDLQHSFADSSDRAAPLSEIINYGRLLRLFAINNVIWLLQNMAYTGGNNYAAMATENPYLSMSINSGIDVFAALIANHFSEAVGRKACTIVSCAIGGCLYMVTVFVPGHGHGLELTLVMLGRLMLTIGYNTQYLYAAEVLPTEIRGTGLAVRQSLGSIGGILAAQVVALSSVTRTLPLLMFGLATLVSGLLMIFLPETKGQPLPQTLQDGDLFGLNSGGDGNGCSHKHCEHGFVDKLRSRLS